MYQVSCTAPLTPDALAEKLAQADALCAARGRRMTPGRRRTLEILLRARRPLGAYEVLELLGSNGSAPQPPVAYRALDFLVEEGLAHKLRETKQFLACAHPEEAHGAAFLICRACGNVDEVCLQPEESAFAKAARNAGFAIERTILEAQGVCAECRTPAR